MKVLPYIVDNTGIEYQIWAGLGQTIGDVNKGSATPELIFQSFKKSTEKLLYNK